MKRNESKFKHGRVLNIAVTVIAAIILCILPISMMVNANSNSLDSIVILTRTANLVSPTGSINPHGAAAYTVYDSGQRELEIEAEDVNAANGTILTFFVDGNNIGQAAIDNQKARLRLKTELGQAVPTVNNGATVQVRNGATVILNGVFGGGIDPTPSPSVSPSVSPTGSPSPSPSVSPTGSPSPSPSPTGSPSPSPNGGDLFAGLTGATLNGVLPNGFAQYELHSNRRELEIRVRQVNLPAGTSLAVTVNTTAVGNLILENGGEGRLRLRTDNGQTVPTVVSGDSITIKNGGTTVLSGTFLGFSATPSPSPTPSGSPSPSPSPSPNQGRYFEAHLSGSQIVPPVTTAANGEVKVFLNQAENQATILGEFHNLSSAQTSASIVLVTGDTSVVVDLGVVGGTNGNFASRTISVVPVQVSQLRTGLWFAVIGSANNPAGEIRGQLTTHSDSNDFDGDGSNDIAVFRPTEGRWYTLNSQGINAQVVGGANDQLVSGDFDGDGKTDAAVFRNQNGSGVWEIKRSSDGGITTQAFGYATDRAVRGDFDGDGRQDLAVYRATSGTWFIQNSASNTISGVAFGAAEDKPVAADFDGDGKTDIAVFRPSTGVWYYLRSNGGGFGAVYFGQAGDVPIAGDFDGDGKADISVFRPANGVWYIQRSSDGTFDFRQFGLGDDIPVAGNYDGDSKTDIAVFRPSTGIWYIWRSVDNSFEYRLFGQNGDIPVPVK